EPRRDAEGPGAPQEPQGLSRCFHPASPAALVVLPHPPLVVLLLNADGDPRDRHSGTTFPEVVTWNIRQTPAHPGGRGQRLQLAGSRRPSAARTFGRPTWAGISMA